MPKARGGQTSFTSGELAPSLLGRIEVARYFAGGRLLRNVLVIPQGGVKRRPGMAHLNQLDDGLTGVRLVPFAFNTEQTYCFALTDGRFRVWRQTGELVHDQSGCPWNGAQAAQMQWAQSADTLLLFHPDVPSQRIRRGVSHSSWTRDALPYTNLPTFDFGGGPEPVISATRGWPECGTFHQGRLYVGGFRSRPSTLMGSVVGDFFNFNRGTGLDDQAIVVTIDSDQVNAIQQMRSARGLQVFTSGANFAPEVSPPYTPKNFALQEQTRRGSKRFSTQAEADGATLFIGRGGKSLRAYLFEDVEQAFRADLLSLLASHLVRDPTELSMRRGSSSDDADHMLIVNSDGAPAVLTTLRSQEVTAFSRWETDGQVRSVAALDSGEVFFATLRNGTIRVELWDEQRVLDASVRVVNAGGFSTVTGLAHLNGLTAHLYLDGAYLGTAPVNAGAVTLPRTARTAEVGLRFIPRVETMPLEPRDQSGALIGRKSRVARVTARVQSTGIFTLQGRPVVYRRLAAGVAVLDTPPPAFTGDLTVRGLKGWREQHVLAVEQAIPGPFTLLALAYDLGIGA